MSLCGDLLRTWCERLLKLQRNEEDPDLRGGILCPACGRIHGRCFDAVYPFLYLADADQDERYLEGAKRLFDWAERNVSREDGSWLNDTDSPWKGTTVFSVIQLIEALEYHGHLLDPETYRRWKERIRRAADFLAGFQEFEVCNVNYRITNSLAMELCARFLGEERYRRRAEELAERSFRYVKDSGCLYGEGRPVDGYSPKGCQPVDIGYNMEESIPSLAQYAWLTKDQDGQEAACRALRYHEFFMLDDGGIDNSFGTRNYKWTYWGSRTSDGCALGYLLAAEREPGFGIPAYRNLKLLERCTHDGFLYGGLHLYEIGEPACVHHAFSHAKVLAGILDRDLERYLRDGELPRRKRREPYYQAETATYFVNGGSYTATVTGYDWEYGGLPGGHVSGGTLSLLWHERLGLLMAAGMCQYHRKEANNMQPPRFPGHECAAMRLEYEAGGTVYSSMYDQGCEISCEYAGEMTVIRVRGRLTDQRQNRLLGEKGRYLIQYQFQRESLRIRLETASGARLTVPIVSEAGEAVYQENGGIRIRKAEGELRLEVREGTAALPRGIKRIYNLVPGVEALKAAVEPDQGRIDISLSF